MKVSTLLKQKRGYRRRELFRLKEKFLCHLKSLETEINRPQLCSVALFSTITDFRVGRVILGLSNPSPCHGTVLLFTVHSPLPFLI